MSLEIKTWSQAVVDSAGYASMGVLASHRGLQLAEDIYCLASKVSNPAPYKIGNFSDKTTMALSVFSIPMVVSHAVAAIEHIQSGQYTSDDIYALSGAIFLGVNLVTTFLNPTSRLVYGVKLATFIGGAAVDVAGLVTAKTKKDFWTQLAMVVLFNSERGGPARALAKGAFDLVTGRQSPGPGPQSLVTGNWRPPTGDQNPTTRTWQPATISKLAAGLLAGVLYAYSPKAYAATDSSPLPVPHQGGGSGVPLSGGVPGDMVVADLARGRRRRTITIIEYHLTPEIKNPFSYNLMDLHAGTSGFGTIVVEGIPTDGSFLVDSTFLSASGTQGTFYWKEGASIGIKVITNPDPLETTSRILVATRILEKIGVRVAQAIKMGKAVINGNTYPAIEMEVQGLSAGLRTRPQIEPAIELEALIPSRYIVAAYYDRTSNTLSNDLQGAAYENAVKSFERIKKILQENGLNFWDETIQACVEVTTGEVIVIDAGNLLIRDWEVFARQFLSKMILHRVERPLSPLNIAAAEIMEDPLNWNVGWGD